MVSRLRRLAGAAAVTVLVTGSLAAPATAASKGQYTPSGNIINPYSPAYGHPYRHGVVPTIQQRRQMRAYEQSHPSPSTANATGPETLAFGGGIDGIGVASSTPKIYLVFWGTQWGTQGTNSNGNLTFSNDTSGGAPYLQQLFKGLGTGNELWSGTMTQYCDGSSVAAGATSCPSGAPHVGYPTGGALAGVWYDNSAAEPASASGHQIGQEAVNAAAHFGNTTAASNRYAQYDILSPTGLNPDGYQTGGFCAWHDYNGDSTLSGGAVNSPYGDIAFTNMPYVMDVGASCGQGFVNSPGTLDGYSIVDGHEYAETVTDQNPAGGWTNQQNNSFGGEENGDECAWISSGQGAAANVTMGTGAFAMQSTWSNDTNRCDTSHPIVGGTSVNDFSISASPNGLTIAQGSSGTSRISTAVTSGSAGTVSLSTSVSPSGPTASLGPTSVTAGGSSTLTVSVGSSVSYGSYTVTVTGTEGTATHSTTVTVTVPNPNGGINNGGFETGNLSGWTASGAATGVSTTAHSGSYSARLGSTSPTNGDSTIAQTFTVPSGQGTLSFWYQVHCPDTVTYDWATATLKDNSAGTTATVLARTCVSSSPWTQVSANVTAGHSYTLSLVSHDDNYPGDPTYTLYDDVALGAASPPPPAGITNGGFETGSLSGWTKGGAAAGISTTAHSGSYSAMLGLTTPTNGDSTLSQSFSAPTGTSTLSLWYANYCPDTVTYDWATVTLKDTTTNTTKTVLTRTCASSSAWTQVSTSVTAGHSYTITLVSHDDNYPGDPTYTLYDDVTVH
jgi:serine protease